MQFKINTNPKCLMLSGSNKWIRILSEMTSKKYRQHKFERPPGATEILLVRHGESRPAALDDPFPLVDGQGDPELAEIGRLQADKVGERLRHLSIDAVYVTNLCRTQQTAAPLCKHLGLDPTIEPPGSA